MLSRARGVRRKIGQPHIGLPVALVDDLAERVADRLREQFDILWQIAGWPDGSPSFGGGAWDGYRAGDSSAAR